MEKKIELTYSQLAHIIQDAIDLGKQYESAPYEADEKYEETMETLLGEDWLEVNNVFDYEGTMDYFLYYHTGIMTEEFAQFIKNCLKYLAV